MRLLLYTTMCLLLASSAAAEQSSATAAAGSGASTTTQVDEQGRPCKIVRQKSGSREGSVSSRVTAGGGKVTAETNAPNSVTVHSGDGGASSSVTTGGSSGSSAAVATGDGDCVITIPEDAPKQPGEK
jgi:hypothetical protein